MGCLGMVNLYGRERKMWLVIIISNRKDIELKIS